VRRHLPSDKRIRWFEDILDNISRVERFTAGFDFPRFVADERVSFAVLHALLIVSEAARRLGTDAESLAPDQPWRAIRGLGNVLRHEYGGVDLGAIWVIVTDDLPALKQAAGLALMKLRSDQAG
jgi:uncharacterized protein with HEPN domain